MKIATKTSIKRERIIAALNEVNEQHPLSMFVSFLTVMVSATIAVLVTWGKLTIVVISVLATLVVLNTVVRVVREYHHANR